MRPPAVAPSTAPVGIIHALHVDRSIPHPDSAIKLARASPAAGALSIDASILCAWLAPRTARVADCEALANAPPGPPEFGEEGPRRVGGPDALYDANAVEEKPERGAADRSAFGHETV